MTSHKQDGWVRVPPPAWSLQGHDGEPTLLALWLYPLLFFWRRR